ncbi:hypothetical protein DL96DRAFT_1712141 [Flagelloscypha sp. PMI_526]|nr:hypothetical protein DL96DRAFT_1712141 [Flagelloscypha sp. PMI_526]
MFHKASLTAAVLVALPLASAMKLQTPTNPTSDGQVTIKWTPEATDPSTFSLELTNESFHNTFAIANNVNTADGQLTLTFPSLAAGDGYTVVAHDISNVNAVLGQTSDFAVGASTVTETTSSTKTGKTTSTTVSVQSISSTNFGTTLKATTSAPPATSAAATSASATAAAPNGASKLATSAGVLGFAFTLVVALF